MVLEALRVVVIDTCRNTLIVVAGADAVGVEIDSMTVFHTAMWWPRVVLKLNGTLNADACDSIWCMFVTLDVLRLRGWLKAEAESNM